MVKNYRKNIRMAVGAAALLAILTVAVTSAIDSDIEPGAGGLTSDTISLQAWEQQAHYISLFNHKIAYWEAGEGETIILLHGFPSSSWDWQHLWGELSQNYRVITLDLLGYGLSAKPWPHSYSIFEQADIVMQLTETLGIERYHLLTHDYGDTVAQELLARHNAQANDEKFLASLCLLNGGLFPETQNHTLSQKLMLSPLGPLLAHFYNQQLFNKNFVAIFGENSKPGPGQLSDIFSLIERQQGVRVIPGLIQYIDERITHRTRWVGALQETEVPLKVIAGSADNLAGENMATRYEDLIAQPDVVRLQGIGHYPHLEAPRALLKAYSHFMQNK